MKKLFLLLAIICALLSTSIAQTMNPEKEKAEIAAFNLKTYNKIVPYEPRPFYITQVNKNNCRVIILINEIPYWLTFFENYGQSQGIYINDYISKSGTQEITIQIYPKEGDEYIAMNADVDIKINYAKDRDDGVNTWIQLANVHLTDSIKNLNLPYYELKIPFKANVPWDHSEEIKNAKNLKEIPDIEEKILAKANQIRDLLVKGDAIAYLSEIEKSDLKTISQLYFTKEECIQDDLQNNPEGWEVMTRTFGLKKRIVYPIENYEIIISTNNKIAVMRTKDKKESILAVNNDGRIRDRPLFLYWPEGADDLKVW